MCLAGFAAKNIIATPLAMNKVGIKIEKYINVLKSVNFISESL